MASPLSVGVTETPTAAPEVTVLQKCRRRRLVRERESERGVEINCALIEEGKS